MTHPRKRELQFKFSIQREIKVVQSIFPGALRILHLLYNVTGRNIKNGESLQQVKLEIQVESKPINYSYMV